VDPPVKNCDARGVNVSSVSASDIFMLTGLRQLIELNRIWKEQCSVTETYFLCFLDSLATTIYSLLNKLRNCTLAA